MLPGESPGADIRSDQPRIATPFSPLFRGALVKTAPVATLRGGAEFSRRHMNHQPLPNRRHQIRGDERSRRLGRALGGVMRVWAATWRVDALDQAGIFDSNGSSTPVIFALWHDAIFTVPPIWHRHVGSHRRAVVLTSASKDGAVLEATMGCFGIGAVRGSSSRRAVAGLIGLRQAMRAGGDTCITPDGPRGPRHVCQPGIIKLAQTTGAPIIPIRCGFSSLRHLNTWDRLIIPLPFSSVRVCFGKPMHVPADADDQGFEMAREALEMELCRPLEHT